MSNGRKWLANSIIAVGVLCIVYFCWINYAGRIFQFFYNISYDENAIEQSDDFFSYDDIPDVFLTGQDLIPTGEDPTPAQPAEPVVPDVSEEPNISVDYSERKYYNNSDIKLVVLRLGVKAGVADGTTTKLLKSAPGLYEISDLPSDKNGRVIIAAHRDVYGSWFYNIDKMRSGDEIKLYFDEKIYVYEYVDTKIVEKNDWSITDKRGYSAVILTSCTPKGTSDKRIAVTGKLIEIIEKK